MENWLRISRQHRHIQSISGFRDESGPGNSSAKGTHGSVDGND